MPPRSGCRNPALGAPPPPKRRAKAPLCAPSVGDAAHNGASYGDDVRPARAGPERP